MKLGLKKLTRPARNRIKQFLKSGPFSKTWGTTRDCLDPWSYLEITASGGLKPCCVMPPLQSMDGTPDSALRAASSAPFKKLRRELLSGKLNSECDACHHRRRVPRSVHRKRVADYQRSKGISNPLEAPFPKELRIDINELCNLRCDYCAVSSPDYVGQEMAPGMFPAMIELVKRMPQGSIIHVNGHGETTYHPKWMDISRQILDTGRRPLITTNLAKNFSNAEIDLLAQFSVITVSLDGADDQLMRAIRKPVRVAHVFATVDRIRASAERQSMSPPPSIGFSVGIYDPSIWAMESFIETLIELGAASITFWNLREYPHQTKVRCLRSLDDAQTQTARAILCRVKERLDAASVRYSFSGEFNDAAGHSLV
jgi:hypothetical protein